MRKFLIAVLCLCLLAVPVKGETREKLVALTFDDGPSGRFTCNLLDGLEERNVNATFLLCGYRMAQYPELVLRIHNSGHEIGLHGYSHKCMGESCRRDAEEEIRRSMALIPEGCDVNFLRSPGGMSSRGVKAAAKDWGLSLLYWSVDPKDWATNDADAVEQQVIRQVKDGDIILLHDMSDSSVEAALVIVDELLEEGFRFVTVSQLAWEKGITPQPGEEYHHFREQKSALQKMQCALYICDSVIVFCRGQCPHWPVKCNYNPDTVGRCGHRPLQILLYILRIFDNTPLRFYLWVSA